MFLDKVFTFIQITDDTIYHPEEVLLVFNKIQFKYYLCACGFAYVYYLHIGTATCS